MRHYYILLLIIAVIATNVHGAEKTIELTIDEAGEHTVCAPDPYDYSHVAGAFDTAIFEVSGKGLRGDIHTISEDHDFWYVLKMFLERAGLGHFDDESSLFHLPAWIPYNTDSGDVHVFKMSPYRKHCVRFEVANGGSIDVHYHVSPRSVSYDLKFFVAHYYVLLGVGLVSYTLGADFVASSTSLHYGAFTIGLSVMFGFLIAYVIINAVVPERFKTVVKATALSVYLGIGFKQVKADWFLDFVHHNLHFTTYVVMGLLVISFAITHIFIIPRMKNERVQEIIRWGIEIFGLVCVAHSTRSPFYAWSMVVATVILPFVLSRVGSKKKKTKSFATAAEGAIRVAERMKRMEDDGEMEMEEEEEEEETPDMYMAKRQKRQEILRRKIARTQQLLHQDEEEEEEDDFESQVSKMTVKQLKSELEERDLSTKGLKAALRARLLEDVSGGKGTKRKSPSSSTGSSKSPTKKRKTPDRKPVRDKRSIRTATKKRKKRDTSALKDARAAKRAQAKARLQKRANELLGKTPARTSKRRRRASTRYSS